jgi:hypothetical protein
MTAAVEHRNTELLDHRGERPGDAFGRMRILSAMDDEDGATNALPLSEKLPVVAQALGAVPDRTVDVGLEGSPVFLRKDRRHRIRLVQQLVVAASCVGLVEAVAQGNSSCASSDESPPRRRYCVRFDASAVNGALPTITRWRMSDWCRAVSR